MWFHNVHAPIEGKPKLIEYFENKVTFGMKDQNYIYAAMIASLDKNVGRILKAIDKTGITERRIVIFFSDLGVCVGEYYN